jgi:hypothetical protein
MWRLVRLFAGLVLLGLIVAVAEWLAPAAHGTAGSCAPENVHVRVVEPSGHAFWVDFIGSGCGGDSPVRDVIHSMIADGFTLKAAGAVCGTYANQCVVIGP